MAIPATVTFSIKNNAWFLLAFRFGTLGDTSWSFAGKHFLCDFKSDQDNATPDLATSSTAASPATILVLDAVNRILQFNVSDHVIRQKLPPGPYRYDLIMVDNITGERDAIMQGTMTVLQGITIED